MSSNSIAQAEQQLYLTLLALAEHYPIAQTWLSHLPAWLSAIKDKRRYAQAPHYASVVARLPDITGRRLLQDFNAANVSAIVALTDDEIKQSEALLRHLMPWRKGGFVIGEGDAAIHIDTEWRSDLKWDRVLPHIQDLKGKRVLDVGGGSGYHGFRMLGAGAQTVMVIDPSCLFYHQFMALKHFLAQDLKNHHGLSPIHFIPVPLDALPYSQDEHGQLFHTVFCMGVLYHRASPFDCLLQLRQQLMKGGELVLETLIVEGDEKTVLVPRGRYAMMNNVYFLPSVPALTLWLEKAGFTDVRCVDVNVTSTDEQRATSWMDYQSLQDFLHPEDANLTLEGYPRPTRVVMIAKRA